MNEILLVQSDPEDLSKLSEILRKGDFSILEAPSVRKAIELVEAEPSIDLVLASISMPERSGLEFLQYVKNSQKLYSIPVIMTSGIVDQEHVVRSATLGASKILTRPFEERIVLSKVEEALSDGRHSVLVVDDEEEILELLKYVIELERFKVLSASSAEEALDILKANRVNAIVSDIMLPQMSGFDLMNVVKEKYENTPVILITAYGGQYTPEVAMDAGADAYFLKPFKNVDLIRKLRQLMPDNPRWTTGKQNLAPRS
jgi:CheY-like chemotaxis protein